MSEEELLKRCNGCRDNFYNGHNSLGVKRCWLLDGAKPVTRWRIGWNTPQDRAENFRRVETNDCHHAPGQYAQYDRLPSHLGGEPA